MDRRLKRGYESLLHSVLLADLLEEEGIADESNSGPRFQIWSFALTLFRAFDFVCPFARSPFFGPFARFPAGKRFFQ